MKRLNLNRLARVVLLALKVAAVAVLVKSISVVMAVPHLKMIRQMKEIPLPSQHFNPLI